VNIPELQELVSLISPYEATANPTGSKRVVAAEEVASEPNKKTYQVASSWTISAPE
jgi:hypothetical protein